MVYVIINNPAKLAAGQRIAILEQKYLVSSRYPWNVRRLFFISRPKYILVIMRIANWLKLQGIVTICRRLLKAGHRSLWENFKYGYEDNLLNVVANQILPQIKI